MSQMATTISIIWASAMGLAIAISGMEQACYGKAVGDQCEGREEPMGGAAAYLRCDGKCQPPPVANAIGALPVTVSCSGGTTYPGRHTSCQFASFGKYAPFIIGPIVGIGFVSIIPVVLYRAYCGNKSRGPSQTESGSESEFTE
eukprot:gnl/TRDRNA2_/TRDRNA2_167221_c0_seq6.p1 gnl/TRDRNA2_/TRDRNA2_167221_c0~~gnl/TRDRNA2_/TRDRNA2_167221_c0_seq6.p1  ORF type:complete len:144 (+),score=4.60 gnl/TRDRNA2_/TRDRNA2_167221_c0_seq6:53-484(+)